MKKLLLLTAIPALFAAAVPAQATELRSSAYLRTRPIGACNYWTSIRDSSGYMAYACSGYPTTMDIVDAYDLDRVINALENKIADLEARLATLEKKQQQ